jgi:hypothetical protein
MRWEDERYVRLYTRDTATWKLLGWQGRFVLMSLLRVVDRAGLLSFEGEAVEAVAATCDLPERVARQGLEALQKRGVVQTTGQGLALPNFLPAQEAQASDAARKRAQRERDRTSALGEPECVTQRDEGSQSVTKGHAESHAVTPSLAVPNQERGPASLTLASPAPGPAKTQKKPRTLCPSSASAGPLIADWCARWAIPNDDAEIPRFLDWHVSRGELRADWSASWRTWKSRAATQSPHVVPPSLAPSPVHPSSVPFRAPTRSATGAAS